MHLALWYVVLVCHQYDVCRNCVGSVYVGGYGGLRESGFCVCHVSSMGRALAFIADGPDKTYTVICWLECPYKIDFFRDYYVYLSN